MNRLDALTCLMLVFLLVGELAIFFLVRENRQTVLFIKLFFGFMIVYGTYLFMDHFNL